MSKWLDAACVWFPIVALFVVMLLALAGCAHPPYLCVPGRLETGQPAMLCHPLPETHP